MRKALLVVTVSAIVVLAFATIASAQVVTVGPGFDQPSLSLYDNPDIPGATATASPSASASPAASASPSASASSSASASASATASATASSTATAAGTASPLPKTGGLDPALPVTLLASLVLVVFGSIVVRYALR